MHIYISFSFLALEMLIFSLVSALRACHSPWCLIDISSRFLLPGCEVSDVARCQSESDSGPPQPMCLA